MIEQVVNCPVVKMSVLEHFSRYMRDNLALIEEEAVKYQASNEKKKED